MRKQIGQCRVILLPGIEDFSANLGIGRVHQRFSVPFAEHFFPTADEHLVGGGVFTYLTNEIDSLSRGHQRHLFENFSSFRLHLVPLELPSDVRDAWWADSMAVIEVVK